jgi:hypothetical protein
MWSCIAGRIRAFGGEDVLADLIGDEVVNKVVDREVEVIDK